MKTIDFEYDGTLASDYNFMVCTFDDGGTDTTEYGSNIDFDTVSIQNGKSFSLVNAGYSEAANFTFQICKNPNVFHGDDMYFTTDEQRLVYRWLNRNDGFHQLKMFTEDFGTLVFNGSFNINAVVLNGFVIGFELTFQMGNPYATQECYRVRKVLSSNSKFTLIDNSDDIGYIYPKLKILCKSDGDLVIKNSIENRSTIIKNCKSGEVITADENLNISSSLPSHKLYNDFNFVFFRIANTYQEQRNIVSINLACEITIEYYPVVKGVGL